MTGGPGGGVTRLMMCTWHQHCSICTICTLATYLPISPLRTRAEVGLNTAPGAAATGQSYSRSCDGHEQRDNGRVG